MKDYGTPAEDKTTATEKPKESNEEIEAKINTIVEQLKEGKEPKEVDSTILLAAKAEKRRRDTQAAYTKAQQEKIALEKEKEALENLMSQETTLSKEQKDELEELKLVDPEEWRTKLNSIEAEQRKQRKQKVEEASKKAKEDYELERRMQVFEDFQKAHPEIKIDDETIENEIPSKYTKDLEQNKISFEDFLAKAYTFLKTNKVAEQPNSDTKPDLSQIPGGATPYESAPGEDLIDLYRNTTL